MNQNLNVQDPQVNTLFARNANKIITSKNISSGKKKNKTVIYNKNSLKQFIGVLGSYPGLILSSLIYHFKKKGRDRLLLTRDDIRSMISSGCCLKTITNATNKLVKNGLIIKEKITKAHKDAGLLSHCYYSLVVAKIEALYSSSLGNIVPTKKATYLTSSKKKRSKISINHSINLGEADLSLQPEISPAKNQEVLPNDNVLPFKLSKRMRQVALDAGLKDEVIAEALEECTEFYEKEASSITKQVFSARIWPKWVKRAAEGWGKSKRIAKEKRAEEEAMAKRIKAQKKQINLTIDPTIKEEDALRIREHLSQLSIAQASFTVERTTEEERQPYWTNLLYKVYLPRSVHSSLTKSNKDLFYQAHLKAVPLLDNNPMFMEREA